MSDFFSIQARSRGTEPESGIGHRGLWQKLDPAVAERIEFLGTFLRKPARTGSFAPSSPSPARAMLYGCNLSDARTVVELGPGTGAFTRLILDRIGKRTLFIALELDARQVRRLRERFPGLNVYHDSAEAIQRYLAQHRRRKTDYIVSGLPWANMRVNVRERILEAVLASLAPDGLFSTFTYVHACWLPSARRFRRRLEERFADVKTSRIIWKNAPPAFVYR